MVVAVVVVLVVALVVVALVVAVVVVVVVALVVARGGTPSFPPPSDGFRPRLARLAPQTSGAPLQVPNPRACHRIKCGHDYRAMLHRTLVQRQ